ncbi:MAG: redoxin domain-containing protein [Chloroflexota bacterium]
MKTKKAGENGRFSHPIPFIAGLLLLGVAGAMLLFGGTLFNKPQEVAFDQIPQLGGETAVVQLPTGMGLLAVGDTAPVFALTDLEGESVTLSDYAGRPVLLNFWATWCPPCRVEMPELQKAFEAHQDDNLAILAINQAETRAEVEPFFAEMGLTFTSLLDNDGTVGQLYGASNLPTSVFISPAGEITAVHRGALTAEQVDGYLESNQ